MGGANYWDSVEAVLRGRFIAIQAYLKKQEKSQINNLTLHLKQLEIEEMKTPGSIIFETEPKYCILYSFVDHDGYSISSKGFLPTVVDIMVI